MQKISQVSLQVSEIVCLAIVLGYPVFFIITISTIDFQINILTKFQQK